MKHLTKLSACLFAILLLVCGCGTKQTPEEKCAVDGINDMKSMLQDPSSLEIRGDMMHLYLADGNETHRYVFIKVAYINNGSKTEDMVYVKDGKAVGSTKDTNLVIMDVPGTTFTRTQEECFNAYKEFKRATETKDDTDNYKRVILSGEKIAKMVSVTHVPD